MAWVGRGGRAEFPYTRCTRLVWYVSDFESEISIDSKLILLCCIYMHLYNFLHTAMEPKIAWVSISIFDPPPILHAHPNHA